MAVQFIPVMSEEQITALAFMADTVWHEWFQTLLSPEQIDYMVDKFQSIPALRKQIVKEGYEYFFLNVNGTNVGYIGIHIEPDTKKLFLSKIYILKPFRGKRYASEAFEFLEGMCQGYQLKSIYLTVNKYNENSIQVYTKRGFQNIKSQVTDIGNGFVMDDYVMEKTF
ncbi:MAG: GNAT family N-acetyltransferase [Lachnospiraceae bacterium]|nr:GNAT family N-acetyltransferase [Lachnospiraceae bacterium]